MLSVLICSLESRITMLNTLVDELNRQINGNPEVQINVYSDNKELTTGRKRQLLLESASGKYIIFIDDDDWIEPCYIEELLKACESDADCFGMNGWITTNGGMPIPWNLSKDNDNKTINRGGGPFYLRTVNHITGVKRSIALQAGFPDKSNAEDKWYSDRVKALVKTEYKIEPLMYHYRYVSTNKEYL